MQQNDWRIGSATGIPLAREDAATRYVYEQISYVDSHPFSA
jgi:hypothetical protein